VPHVAGICLSTADLRAGIVEALCQRFNVARVAVSAGEPVAGRTD
jgi:hypothetical protein